MTAVSSTLEVTCTSDTVPTSERLPGEFLDADDEPPPKPGALGETRAGSPPETHLELAPTRPPRRHVPLLTVVPGGPAAGVRSRTPTSAITRAFRRAHYPAVADADWNDWHWQIRHRIRTAAELERFLVLTPEERKAVEGGGATLPLGITPYYLSLISPTDGSQPLRRTVVPSAGELLRSLGEAADPLGEEGHSAVPGLVHRYPDRVLLLVHDFCTTYCRYCTRSRKVGQSELGSSRESLLPAIEYIRAHREIRDVLLSGGDPLSLADEKLGWILEQLRSIPHVELLRIGTKVPVVLPQRVTVALTRMLRRFHPLWMSVHFTHPDECTPEVQRACTRLADAGIPLGSQTVLLRGVNDEVATMKRLMHELVKMRVRPYYLYQCDPILGSAHFRTPVAKGLEILAGLRGHTSGYAVPTYVIDAPGGGGKIPLLPPTVVGRDGDDLLLQNYAGGIYRYTDPV
jgi:lysine 2,3-aminomutase